MLANDLLAQARLLATKEPKRPKQASLRRAISSAYYGLFHFLVDQACRFLISGAAAERKALREQLARSFEHGAMKSASQAFAGSGSSPWVQVGGTPTSELLRVAEAFVMLQRERHAADYDVSRSFTRGEALALVAQAEDALRDWQKCRGTPAADAYLLAMLVRARR